MRCTGHATGVQYFALKWLCGVDLNEKKLQLTKDERRQLQIKATNITEKPFWKKVVDVNGVICCAACFFLHGFWA
jgi:solute carrier family 5 (sodium/glucose cotransporter), member 9